MGQDYKIHKLKTHPQYYQAIRDALKRFEFRKNDRDFKVGDKLILEEYNPELKEYTGRASHKRIYCILEDFQGLENGYCVFKYLKTNKTKLGLCTLLKK